MSPPNSLGLIFSAMVVEPRRSAKRTDISTSAPPTANFAKVLWHDWQKRGLFGHWANPRWRITAPPGPANGALHSLQRGGDGKWRNKSRPRMTGSVRSPLSSARHSSELGAETDPDMSMVSLGSGTSPLCQRGDIVPE